MLETVNVVRTSAVGRRCGVRAAAMSGCRGRTHRARCGVASILAVSTGVLAGCASGPPVQQPVPGELPAGTAVATVNGTTTGKLHDVGCLVTQDRTTLTVGTPDSGLTAVVRQSGGVVVDSVVINGLHGFSGSQWRGLEGDAHGSMVGSTFIIEGTATGWTDEDPSHRAVVPFTLRTTC